MVKQVKRNGELYVSRRLDRESTSSYTLTVSATDGVFVSSCRVGVEILDDNDSKPRCLKSSYEVRVEEGANAGGEVVKVEAEDDDEGPNARQEFYLEGEGADMFSIDR